jgi:twitching motility two-component system response regulator PilH
VGILAETGYELLEAKDGVEGLAMAIEYKPDCIFTDLLMPKMDGFTLLKNLRQQHLQIPVIVVTADIQQTSKQICLQLGAKNILNKPPSAQDVLDALNQALASAI